MKKYLLSIWITFSLLIEITMSKMGIIKYFDLMAMDDPLPMDNMGGTLAYIYVALEQDIETWPTEADPATATMDVLQVLTGSLVCKTGKNFFKTKLEPEKCIVSSPDVGPKGGISQKHILKIYKGDMSAKILGLIRATNNQELVFAIPDANGKMLFLGNQKYPARKMPEGEATTGEGPEGESGVAMTFVSYGNGPVPVLDSSITIPTTPAV